MICKNHLLRLTGLLYFSSETKVFSEASEVIIHFSSNFNFAYFDFVLNHHLLPLLSIVIFQNSLYHTSINHYLLELPVKNYIE